MAEVPTLEVRTSAVAVDVDLVPVFQDGSKKPIAPQGPYAATLQKFQRINDGQVFTGRQAQTQFVRFGGQGKASSVCLLGFGQAGEVTEEKARSAGGAAWSKLVAERAATVAVDVDAFLGAQGFPEMFSPFQLLRPFAEGLILGAYQWDKYKAPAAAKGGKRPEPKYAGPTRISFVTADAQLKATLQRQLEQVAAVLEAVNVTRDWSNEPPNHGTPEYFADEARRLARQYGLKCTVLTEREAARERMNLFLAVGQGSVREGRIVVLEHAPKRSAGKAKGASGAKTLALVGKGITFDTGGISIKPALKMEEMKHDMTGAATVMGAMILAALWQVPNRVVGVMAFTENMPDGDAIVPGTVIRARSGKTVEINNTDAEGRLILADALDYAQDFKPDAVVNIATLTGAIGIALGKHNAGLFGNDDGILRSVKAAGERNGEKMWEMPCGDEYFEDLKSETADMRNVGSDTLGGSIRGAVFLKQFIRPRMPWAHLDIAYVGSNVSHLSYVPKRGASGLFVRTLAQLASDL